MWLRKPLPRNRGAKRNNSLVDTWSWVHFATGILLGWVMHPVIAAALMLAWEPLEIFVLSPLLAKVGIDFGYETWRNSASDMVFDIAGVLLGSVLLTSVAAAPFHLF